MDPSPARGPARRARRPVLAGRDVARACPSAQIDAVELDASRVGALEASQASAGPGGHIILGDFRTVDLPRERYDVAVANVPFTGGEEGEHLARILDVCDRALLLLPARSLHGMSRYRMVWTRFSELLNPSERWYLRQKVHRILRPRFAEGGGVDEIVLLDVRRAPGACVVRWG